jgi:allophanate hydrolase
VTIARFAVDYAGPLTTVQDRGRFGYQRFGVTESGPLDRAAFDIGQAAVGAKPGRAAIEVGPAGLSLHCLNGAVSVAITGGCFWVEIGGAVQHSWMTATVRQGTTISVRPGLWGTWCYLAIAGEIRWPVWLGSRATHPAQPFTGRPLAHGDEIVVDNAEVLSDPERAVPVPIFCRPRQEVRLVVGPQERYFAPDSLESLLSQTYRLSNDFDRMGVRLDGSKISITSALDMPSEGVLRGAVQVPGSGDPIVLLADHQTTGGYPKIATVISADLDRFVQLRPGQSVQFRAVSVEQAVASARTHRIQFQNYIAEMLRSR